MWLRTTRWNPPSHIQWHTALASYTLVSLACVPWNLVLFCHHELPKIKSRRVPTKSLEHHDHAYDHLIWAVFKIGLSFHYSDAVLSQTLSRCFRDPTPSFRAVNLQKICLCEFSLHFGGCNLKRVWSLHLFLLLQSFCPAKTTGIPWSRIQPPHEHCSTQV